MRPQPLQGYNHLTTEWDAALLRIGIPQKRPRFHNRPYFATGAVLAQGRRMAEINNKDRSILAEAGNLAGLDFTAEERSRIAELAAELKHLLDRARHRMRDRARHTAKSRAENDRAEGQTVCHAIASGDGLGTSGASDQVRFRWTTAAPGAYVQTRATL